MDYEDLDNLMKIEETIETVTKELNEAIVKESDLEIILIGELKHHDNTETLSLKNKMIKLRSLPISKQTEVFVDDWLKATTEIKILRNVLRQVEGRRDSIKKKISIQDKLN